ncbi:hypothetical protein LX32DRAFT_722519 [Colletotrichum zoysiae]|uniref:Uncharacterized protein n=1 Tax=Colletotrichum zoysiae TaxID=1216348 RepID=A0AAD9LYL7_9PEZI|nr:hypothetical protein LX32DRAFT_722519 [Colletotrichum zoysiae]
MGMIRKKRAKRSDVPWKKIQMSGLNSQKRLLKSKHVTIGEIELHVTHHWPHALDSRGWKHIILAQNSSSVGVFTCLRLLSFLFPRLPILLKQTLPLFREWHSFCFYPALCFSLQQNQDEEGCLDSSLGMNCSKLETYDYRLMGLSCLLEGENCNLWKAIVVSSTNIFHDLSTKTLKGRLRQQKSAFRSLVELAEFAHSSSCKFISI